MHIRYENYISYFINSKQVSRWEYINSKLV